MNLRLTRNMFYKDAPASPVNSEI